MQSAQLSEEKRQLNVGSALAHLAISSKNMALLSQWPRRENISLKYQEMAGVVSMTAIMAHLASALGIETAGEAAHHLASSA